MVLTTKINDSFPVSVTTITFYSIDAAICRTCGAEVIGTGMFIMFSSLHIGLDFNLVS